MDTYKNYDTFKNIIALLILLFLFFITSNIESLNNFVLKKNIRLLILCLLIYFIYSKIDLTFLILIIIIFIVFNTNIYNILINKNSYVKYFNDKFDISNIFNNNNNKEKENFSNKKKDDVFSKEIDDIEEKINHLKNISNDYDFKPFVNNNKTIINNDKYINTNDNNSSNNNINSIDNNINENYKNNEDDKDNDKDKDKNIIIPFKENIDIIKNKFKEIESNFKNNI